MNNINLHRLTNLDLIKHFSSLYYLKILLLDSSLEDALFSI